MFGNRPVHRVIRGLAEPRHYVALARHFLHTRHPIRWTHRYVTGRGEYPSEIEFEVRSESSRIKLYSSHDLLTYNEIFSRRDYPVKGDEKVIVDCGGNIGISVIYFQLMCPQSRIYVYEPLPINLERLKSQPALDVSRVDVRPFAVSTEATEADFCVEPTGRYGSLVQRRTTTLIRVACRNLEDDLKVLISQHGSLGILKLDVEGVEEQLLRSLPQDVLENIDGILAEHPFAENPIPDTHSWYQNGPIGVFRRVERH